MTLTDFIVIAVVVFVLFNVVLTSVLGVIYAERKVLARLQQRVGPSRTGPFGLLQTVAKHSGDAKVGWIGAEKRQTSEQEVVGELEQPDEPGDQVGSEPEGVVEKRSAEAPDRRGESDHQGQLELELDGQ